MTLSLPHMARQLGGVVTGRQVLCPGPGHSPHDRSLSVRIEPSAADGLIVHSFAGDDFRECRDHVKARLGIKWEGRQLQPPSSPRTTRHDDGESRKRRALALWNEARDPRGTLAERYLARRRLELSADLAGAVLRFHPACPWRDKAGDLTRVPAMLAVMRNIATDQITAVQRTALDKDGAKRGRRMLGVAAAAAIKFDNDDAVTTGLIVGEGAETVLSGRQVGFRPAWALGSAGAIATLPVLTGIEALSIHAEHDETGANARAIEECGSRWQDAGRLVITIAPRLGNDLNDAIRMQGAL